MGTFRGVELDALVLSGDRLQLRPWRPDDASWVHAVLQDDAMHEFLALPHPYTADDARYFVGDAADSTRGRAAGTVLDAAIVETSSGRLVGGCELRLDADPEIGYFVAPDARGRGYCAEAIRTLTRWAFDCGASRVRVACDVRNLASVKCALAAGFAFEGVARGAVTSAAKRGAPERRGSLARFARLATDSGDPIGASLAPLPGGRLSDGVLALRVALPEDAAGLMASDDELTLRWSFDGRPVPEGRARAATAEAGLNWLVGRSTFLSMIDVATGAWAGEVALRSAGPPGVCALGYVVHPAFRGRGYTTRALRLVAGWAFGTAGLARLELGAKVGNVASQTAARRAGFVAEGVLAGRLRALDGSYHDEARFALLNPACERRS